MWFGIFLALSGPDLMNISIQPTVDVVHLKNMQVCYCYLLLVSDSSLF